MVGDVTGVVLEAVQGRIALRWCTLEWGRGSSGVGEGSLAAAWKLLEEVLCGMECCKKYYIYVSWVHMWLGSAWFEHWRAVLGSSGPPPPGLEFGIWRWG